MQRVHSYYCHLNLERRDLRAATQRSACLQSNSACCQNRAPPEFRGTKPHGNSAKIILFFQIPLLGQEIHRGSADFPETGQERTRPPRYPFPAQVSLPGCHSAAVVSRRAIPRKTSDTSLPAKPATHDAVISPPAMSPIRGGYAPRSAAWRRIRWLRRRGLSAGRGRRRMP